MTYQVLSSQPLAYLALDIMTSAHLPALNMTNQIDSSQAADRIN